LVRKGLPSFTALVVAGARAAAEVDAIAEHLVPRPFGAALRALRGSEVARVLSLGLIDHLALRTRAIDDVVVRSRHSQLVVLGAGLDARAFRLEALGDTVVFEIDHPSTQAYKRARASALICTAREVRFVGVDFERDDLGARLASAGHDPAAPTTWIWEGVTPYLTRSAVHGTLDVVAALSAPESVLVMTYGTPELGSVPGALRPLVGPVFRLLGEELRGLMTPEAMRAIVRSHDLDVIEDERVTDHAARQRRRAPRLIVSERVLVARPRRAQSAA
jgi:methyltransferase (TIGR00027 family)